jgi:hypothetical protein
LGFRLGPDKGFGLRLGQGLDRAQGLGRLWAQAPLRRQGRAFDLELDDRRQSTLDGVILIGRQQDHRAQHGDMQRERSPRHQDAAQARTKPARRGRTGQNGDSHSGSPNPRCERCQGKHGIIAASPSDPVTEI